MHLQALEKSGPGLSMRLQQRRLPLSAAPSLGGQAVAAAAFRASGYRPPHMSAATVSSPSHLCSFRLLPSAPFAAEVAVFIGAAKWDGQSPLQRPEPAYRQGRP